MRSVASLPDPNLLHAPPLSAADGISGITGRPLFSAPAGPYIVVLFYGQSQTVNIMGGPGFVPYTPASTGNLNLNFLDGGLYLSGEPMMGCDQPFGNSSIRLADKIIETEIFESVITVPFGIGGTFASQWAAGGNLNRRITVACNRAAKLIAGSAKTVILRMQGESDAEGTTTQAQYEAFVQSELATFRAAGVTAPMFVSVETWDAGRLPPNAAAIRAAQMALVDNVNIFAGPDFDTLDNRYRYGGLTHFSEWGADQVASMWLSALQPHLS
jgi:hypothetical protein